MQVLDDEGPPPVPEGQAWGEVGVCEICLHVRGVAEVHASLVAAGCEELMAPISAAVVPNDVDLDISYVADPWGTKLELIEWTGLWRSLPGPARAEGVNHVAFGVTDMPRTRAFYERLGFTELLFESFEFFDPMAPWYTEPWYDPERLPAQHMTMPMPLRARRSSRWSSIRPGTTAAGSGGISARWTSGSASRTSTSPSRSCVPTGSRCTASRSAIDLGGGREWRYVSFAEPDGNYVSLVEARY